MKIIILFSLLIIISLNFHITYIISVIFNFINQYLISADVNNLLKNNIDFININIKNSFKNLKFLLT